MNGALHEVGLSPAPPNQGRIVSVPIVAMVYPSCSSRDWRASGDPFAQVIAGTRNHGDVVVCGNGGHAFGFLRSVDEDGGFGHAWG